MALYLFVNGFNSILFSLVSIMLISDIFFIRNFCTNQSGPNFSEKFCCNFKLRTDTTTWKLWVLLPYESLVYSSGLRENQTLARNLHFYGNNELFFDQVSSRLSKQFNISRFKSVYHRLAKEGNSFYSNKIVTN